MQINYTKPTQKDIAQKGDRKTMASTIMAKREEKHERQYEAWFLRVQADAKPLAYKPFAKLGR